MEQLLSKESLVAILGTTSIFIFMIYLGLNRNKKYLYFFFHVFFLSIGIVAEINQHITILFILLFFSFCSLIFFYSSFFKKQSRLRLIISFCFIGYYSYFGTTLIGNTYTVMAWVTYYFTLMFSSIYPLIAMKKKEPFSVELFFLTSIMFISFLLFLTESFFFSNIVIGSLTLTVSIIYIILLDIKNQASQIHALKERAIQLENEMLKKTIQPHFLLNTLTIITEWIETKPNLAIDQINLLSNEFRYIIKAAKEKLVPIEDEINLCKNYLNMFNLKQSKMYSLIIKLEKKTEKIPPLVFHTLIENGLVHSDDTYGNEFIIEQFISGSKRNYIITSPGVFSSNETKEGLGLNYIKSRLETSYPSKWTFKNYQEKNNWITEIGFEK